MSTPSLSPDQLAAHDLLTELRTRVTTQPLPYQHGVETRALASLVEIFSLARKAMKDHPERILSRRLGIANDRFVSGRRRFPFDRASG